MYVKLVRSVLKYANRQQKEPKGQVRDVSEAWESLATDIFEFKG